MKKILAQILIFSLLFNMCVPAFANANFTGSYVETEANDSLENAKRYNQLQKELLQAMRAKDFTRQAVLWKELKELRKAMNNTAWKQITQRFQADVANIEEYYKMYVQLYNIERDKLEGSLDNYDFKQHDESLQHLKDLKDSIDFFKKKMQSRSFITTKILQEMENEKSSNHSVSHYAEKFTKPDIPTIGPQVRNASGLAYKIEHEEDGVKFEDLIGYISPVDQALLPPADPELVAVAATLLGNTVEMFPYVVGNDNKEGLKALATNKGNLWETKHPYRVDLLYIQVILLKKINELKEKLKTEPSVLDILALSELRIALLKIIKFYLDNDIPNPTTFHNKQVTPLETGFGKFQRGDDNPEIQRASQRALLEKMQNDFIAEMESYLNKTKSSQTSQEFEQAIFLASEATKYTLLNDPKQLKDLVSLVNKARGHRKIEDVIDTSFDETGGEKLNYHFAPVVASVFSTINEMVQQASVSDSSLQEIMNQLVEFVGPTDKKGKDQDYILPIRLAAVETASFFSQNYLAKPKKDELNLPTSFGPLWASLPSLSTDLNEFFAFRATQIYCPLAQTPEQHTDSIYGLGPDKVDELANRLAEIIHRFSPPGGVISAPGQGPRFSQPLPCVVHSINNNKSLHTASTLNGVAGFFKEVILWVFIPEMIFARVARVYRMARGLFASLPRSYKQARNTYRAVRLQRKIKTINYTGKTWKPAAAELRGTATEKVAQQVKQSGAWRAAADESRFAAKQTAHFATEAAGQGAKSFAKEAATQGAKNLGTEAAAHRASNVGRELVPVNSGGVTLWQPVSEKLAEQELNTPWKAAIKMFFESEKTGAQASELIRGAAKKRNLVTFFTREEKNGQIIDKPIRSNKELKKLIKEGKLEEGGLFASQPALDANGVVSITEWRLAVPQKANYVDIGNAMLRQDQWEVVSGTPGTVMKKLTAGERSAISEKLRLQSRIEAKLLQQGGVDVYVETESGIQLLPNLSKEALQELGHTTPVYILPKGSLSKSSAKKLGGMVAKETAENSTAIVTTKEIMENSGAVKTTLREWQLAGERAFPDVLKGQVATFVGNGFTTHATSLMMNEVYALFYGTQIRAAADLATPLILSNGTGRAARTIDALRKILPQVKVAPAFSRAAAPEWIPANLKSIATGLQRFSLSQFSGNTIFFGTLLIADQVKIIQDAFLKMSEVFANQDMQKLLQDKPALREFLAEEEKKAAQEGNKKEETQGPIVTDALKPASSYEGITFFLPLLPIWRMYTNIKNELGIQTAKWSELRLITDDQEEELLLNNYYVEAQKILGQETLQKMAEKSGIKYIKTELGNLREKVKKDKVIHSLSQSDDKLLENIDAIYNNAINIIESSNAKNIESLVKWIQTDVEIARGKADAISRLDEDDKTDTKGTRSADGKKKQMSPREGINTSFDNYLNRVQTIRTNTTITSQQREETLVKEFKNTLTEITLIVNFSKTSQRRIFPQEIPDPTLKQQIDAIYDKARSVILSDERTLKEKQQAGNKALKEQDLRIQQYRIQQFLAAPEFFLFAQTDPEFVNQIVARWNTYIGERQKIWDQDLSDKKKMAKLQNLAIRFDSQNAKIMNEEEIKTFLLQDGLKKALALVYPEYGEEVRATFEARNQELQKIDLDSERSEGEKFMERYKQQSDANLILQNTTYKYQKKAAQDTKFWSKFAHAPETSQETWNEVAKTFVTFDMVLLYAELEKENITLTDQLQDEIEEQYEVFLARLESIYNEDDIDAEMMDFMTLQMAYKGAVFSSYRHHQTDRRNWK